MFSYSYLLLLGEKFPDGDGRARHEGAGGKDEQGLQRDHLGECT